MTNKGDLRAILLVALSCIGSFLSAYDTGIIGGILTFESFQKDFGFTAEQQPDVSSLSASLLQAGAFFSCFFAWPFTARFGRRWSLVLAAMIFNVGAAIQLIPRRGRGPFYAGRVISGVGVGLATVIIPMYSAEMAPKKIRGSLGSMFQFFFTLGVMTSYWIDYAVSEHVKPSTRQWQIPVGLQLVPGGLLALGMLYPKESARWLAKKERVDDALASLIWVRGGDSPEVQEEMSEILLSIEAEKRITNGLTWKEFLLPANHKRVALAISLQIGVQLTGNTSLAYYLTAVGAGGQKLLIRGFFGVVKVVSCLFFLLFLIERLGRRGSLAIGALMMGAYMLIIAILTKTNPPSDATTGISSTGIASVAMIYLEAMTYNTSWGPVPWVYVGEIFPNRLREGGIAVSTATQWLFNFVFSQITPHAVDNLGWRTFLMFAIFNWSLVFYVWFFIKETKGVALEQMEAVFDSAFSAPRVNSVKDVEATASDKTPENPQHLDVATKD